MTELLFIAITIFAAYAVFSVVKTPESQGESNDTPPPAPEQPEQDAQPAEPASASEQPAAVTAKASKPAKTPASKSSAKSTTRKSSKASAPASTEAAPAAEPAAAPANDSDSIKNPKTGEVSKIPGNYAFAKRWIKDALVSEGLLDKVYKNTELDNATQAKIQSAIQQLKSLPNYRP